MGIKKERENQVWYRSRHHNKVTPAAPEECGLQGGDGGCGVCGAVLGQHLTLDVVLDEGQGAARGGIVTIHHCREGRLGLKGYKGREELQ